MRVQNRIKPFLLPNLTTFVVKNYEYHLENKPRLYNSRTDKSFPQTHVHKVRT